MAWNIFNRFYYGKAGQADFTTENLPANRWQLFWQMLRVRLSSLVGVNLLYALFCLPGIVWTVVNLMALLGSAQEGSINLIENGLMTIYLLGMIPCLAVAGIGATGEMYVLRNWARDQHAFVLSDFKDAVKGNWKYGLLVGLINGLSLFLVYICYMFYGHMSRENWLWVIPQMLSLTVCALWWMINMIIYPMMVTYDMKFKVLVRNSAIMVVARLPWSLLFLVTTSVLPALLSMVYLPYSALIVALFFLLIGFAFNGFIYASYANSCFDKYLNPRIEGAAVGRGLRQDDDEDDEDVEDPNPVI